jgi:NTP pyrophosphatase (non-canonical NTP hydrolase)
MSENDFNYDEHPIDRVYVEWANTLDSAGRDSTGARERLADPRTIEIIERTINDIVKAGVEADLIKKWVFYNKTIDSDTSNVPEGMLADWMVNQARDNFDNHETVRIFHAILGMVTEAAELMEMLRDHIFSGMPIDMQNLIEETGDSLWYHALIAKACGFATFDEFMASNKAKLTKRYGTTWNQEGALNRDTAAEMEALEGGLKNDSNKQESK